MFKLIERVRGHKSLRALKADWVRNIAPALKRLPADDRQEVINNYIMECEGFKFFGPLYKQADQG